MPKALADNAVFIIADIYHAQAKYDVLVERFNRKRVVALQSLYVRTPKNGGEGNAVELSRLPSQGMIDELVCGGDKAELRIQGPY